MYIDPSGHTNLWLKKVTALLNLKQIAYEQYSIAKLSIIPGLGSFIDARFYYSVSCFESNKIAIAKAAAVYGVPSCLIGAIIFKEQFTQSIPDEVANCLTFISGDTHSTGLGAIFPETAREAWERVDPSKKLPEKNADLQYLLTNDDEFNIKTIAVVLVYEALEMELIDSPEDMQYLTL